MLRARLAIASTACLLLALTAARAAPSDEFAAACGLSGKTSPQSCQCQAKLARTTLNAAELRTAIVGMRDGQAALHSALAAMGEAKAQVFIGKMKSLAGRVATACP